MGLLTWIKERLRPRYEPEYEETVDHDVVTVGGEELTADDPEEGQ